MNFPLQKLGHLEGVFLQKYLFFIYLLAIVIHLTLLSRLQHLVFSVELMSPAGEEIRFEWLALRYLSLAFLAPLFAMEIFAGRTPVKYTAAVVGG